MYGQIEHGDYISPKGLYRVKIPVLSGLGGTLVDTPNVVTFDDDYTIHTSIAAFPLSHELKADFEAHGTKEFLKSFFIFYIAFNAVAAAVLLAALALRPQPGLTCRALMRHPVSLTTAAPIQDAVHLLIEDGTELVVVTEADGQYAGVVTRRMVLTDAQVEQRPLRSWPWRRIVCER